MKKCRECGAEFRTSRTGKTVRCPACREARRPTIATRVGFYEEKMIEAKLAAYTARREGRVEAEKIATAEYLHFRTLIERG